MPNYSLIFAATHQDADDSAVIDWGWYRDDELHTQYRRPDNHERARFVQDGPQSLQNLRWSTRIYLGRNWKRRTDASQIMGLLDSGFFVREDPELPPPRPRRKERVITTIVERER